MGENIPQPGGDKASQLDDKCAQDISRTDLKAEQGVRKLMCNAAKSRDSVVRALDRAYLQGLLEDRELLLNGNTCSLLEPLFERYVEDIEMSRLLEHAAEEFSNTVVEVALFVLAQAFTQDAIEFARYGRRLS